MSECWVRFAWACKTPNEGSLFFVEGEGQNSDTRQGEKEKIGKKIANWF